MGNFWCPRSPKSASLPRSLNISNSGILAPTLLTSLSLPFSHSRSPCPPPSVHQIISSRGHPSRYLPSYLPFTVSPPPSTSTSCSYSVHGVVWTGTGTGTGVCVVVVVAQGSRSISCCIINTEGPPTAQRSSCFPSNRIASLLLFLTPHSPATRNIVNSHNGVAYTYPRLQRFFASGRIRSIYYIYTIASLCASDVSRRIRRCSSHPRLGESFTRPHHNHNGNYTRNPRSDTAIAKMLLPSALSCESSSSSSTSLPKPYYQSTTLFASPPISPPSTSHSHSSNNQYSTTAMSSLFSTCRTLQSMLSPPPSQLPSPPTQHMSAPIISSPFKLRLRNRGKSDDSGLTARKKITKRAISSTSAPPRGINKRRRAIEDETSRESVDFDDEEEEERDLNQNGKENMNMNMNMSNEQEVEGKEEEADEEQQREEGPRTPKRLRLAPEILPLGLERSDFHALHLQHQLSSQPLFFPTSSLAQASNPFSSSSHQTRHVERNQTERESREGDEERGEEEWTTEQDRLLVELVLEKLKLSKSDWQDCARSLGRDRGSVGRRWKSLMAVGDVGLKGRSRVGGAGVGVGGMGGKRLERRGIYGSWR